MKKLWKSTWRYRRDLRNMLKYGLGAPKSCQLMYCRPSDITRHSTFVDMILPERSATIPERFAKHPDSLRPKMWDVIAGGDWDTYTMPIDDVLPYRLTLEKLSTGQSWEEVGEFARMEDLIRVKGGSDGCKNRQDVERRYARMDDMVNDIKQSRRLQTRKERGEASFRELGGINMAIDRDGSLIKLQGGTHRLAIAAHFELPAVPVCIRIVHENCVQSGKFKALMEQSSRLAAETKTPAGGPT